MRYQVTVTTEDARKLYEVREHLDAKLAEAVEYIVEREEAA
jgi:hypothetical protein